MAFLPPWPVNPEPWKFASVEGIVPKVRVQLRLARRVPRLLGFEGTGGENEDNAAVWQIGEIELEDSGPDGVRGNADDEVFAVQGVFVP